MDRRKDFLSFWDLTDGGIEALIARAEEFRLLRALRAPHATRPGRILGMVFEKASTRTRASFEIAMFELGGHALYLGTQGSQLGRGEPIRDTARVLSGYCHGIMVRTFGQDRAAEMAQYARVPVINGLTDLLHPCQVLADLQTVVQRYKDRGDVGQTLRSVKYAWIGDGNNMANSWIEAAGHPGPRSGARAARPASQPDRRDLRIARAPPSAGASASCAIRPKRSRDGTSCPPTSSRRWARRARPTRVAAPSPGYCIDAALMARADADAIVLHCLPAHRDEEITDDVIEGPSERGLAAGGEPFARAEGPGRAAADLSGGAPGVFSEPFRTGGICALGAWSSAAVSRARRPPGRWRERAYLRTSR